MNTIAYDGSYTINLEYNGLTGSIPPEMGQLAGINFIRLDNNQLSGPIPADIGGLTKLRRLDLENNRLNGPIPAELGDLKDNVIDQDAKFFWLTLQNNQLTGSVPAELGDLDGVTALYLYDNRLAGPIPAELGNMAAMNTLLLHNNNLDGSIPGELKKLSKLRFLWLSNNHLSGPIPAAFADSDAFGGKTKLNGIDLKGNQLTSSATVTITRTDTNPEQTPPEDMTEDGGAATIEVDVTGLDKGTQWAANFKTNDDTPVDTVTAGGKINVSGLGGNRVRFNVSPVGGPPLSIPDNDNKQEDITFTLTPTNDTTHRDDETITIALDALGAPGVADVALTATTLSYSFTLSEDDPVPQPPPPPATATPTPTPTPTATPIPTPTDPCADALTADGTSSGTWADNCQSQADGRGYARYFTFTLAQQTDVTITLDSTTDPYLYLRSGGKTGTVVAENDDHNGDLTKSQIVRTLAAGSYTIEATTYSPALTGSFTLTIAGLGSGSDGGGTPTPTSTGTPADPCAAAITADGTTNGTWAANCQSQVTGRGYARYFTFTLSEQRQVTITLESGVDTYLYLRAGSAKSGDAAAENDDIAPGTNLNSQISQSLAAGSYTIEATTYAQNTAGSFTLTIAGLNGGGGGAPGPTPTDPCAGAITADGATTGTWAAGCQSQVAGRGYARYHTFTLSEQRAVTITLESAIDTYLYLRSGSAKSGDAVAENDDLAPGSNLNSQISRSLPAGTYTIEATTYAAGQAGSFTLTIAGLNGGGGGGPTPTDPCADALTADGPTTGTWAAGCQSQVDGRGYARYFTFTLAEQRAVTITLESSIDTYLYLRSGSSKSGPVVDANDDIAPGSNLNSQINRTLAAGSYTIEATTYAAAQVGSFTLTIAGLNGGGGPAPTDPCADALTADGTVSGTWAADCQSQVDGRGYARYHTFTVSEQRTVTITLESAIDTYLYLRSGSAKSGTVLAENDDIAAGSNLNSQISRTLTAGSYTIEATTYAAGQAGNFTLTIAGLGGG